MWAWVPLPWWPARPWACAGAMDAMWGLRRVLHSHPVYAGGAASADLSVHTLLSKRLHVPPHLEGCRCWAFRAIWWPILAHTPKLIAEQDELRLHGGGQDSGKCPIRN